MKPRKKARVNAAGISKKNCSSQNLHRQIISGEKLATILKSSGHTNQCNSNKTTPHSILRWRRSVSQSVRVLRSQKSASFNVFQLLVPKEKIEIVVDDTPGKMHNQADDELQPSDVIKSIESKETDGKSDLLLDVNGATEISTSRNEQRTAACDNEPEIILLDKVEPGPSVSDEIICIQDSNVRNEVGPSSSIGSNALLHKTVRQSTSEKAAVIGFPGQQATHQKGKQFFFQQIRPPPAVFRFVHPLISSPPLITSMPVFSDLLSEATLLICKRLIRRWDVVEKGRIYGKPFRVCSYNVLCQQTAQKTPELYTHLFGPSRTHELAWESRWRLLAREFSMINADIFCLQEVQCDHYIQFYRPLFEGAGYRGEYKKRTGTMVDGCAIFYKSHFQLLRYQHIEYYLSSNSVLDRDNIGQLIRLKDMRNKRELCIANTHLLFNKRRGDVKLAQLAVLIANIDKECGPDSGHECPYALCGDLNVEPYSPLYNFIISGGISFNNLRRGDVSGQGSFGGPFVSANLLPDDVKITRNCRFNDSKNRTEPVPAKNCWSHPLCFSSVYHHAVGGSEPEISTCHSVEAANPDYIFYSVKSKELERSKCGEPAPSVDVHKTGLQLIRRLTLPSLSDIKSTLGPWPNSATPSDHIPLIADFVLQ